MTLEKTSSYVAIYCESPMCDANKMQSGNEISISDKIIKKKQQGNKLLAGMRLNAQVDPEAIEITLDDTSSVCREHSMRESMRQLDLDWYRMRGIIYCKAQRVRARINDKPVPFLSDCIGYTCALSLSSMWESRERGVTRFTYQLKPPPPSLSIFLFLCIRSSKRQWNFYETSRANM